MDTLLQIEQSPSNTKLTLMQALLLCSFVTFTTFLGITHGKHTEKTLSHTEIPYIYNATRISRRIDE